MINIYKNNYIKVFLFSIIIRIVYLLFSYTSEINFTSCCDFQRYNIISNRILSGNFDMSAENFIAAPLFPIFMAISKLLSLDNFVIIIQIFQILISSVSVIYIMKITKILFEDKRVVLISGLLSSVYPFTFWYVIFLGQEILFQSLLIVSIYYLCKFLKKKKNKFLFIFSILFTLSMLTKSHIILFVPFVLIIFIIQFDKCLKKIIKSSLIFFVTIFLVSLPNSLNNINKHGYYILSSTGAGYHFLVAHNDDFYKWTFDPPKKNSQEYKRLFSMKYNITKKIDFDNVGLNQKQLDKLRFSEGLIWIFENPKKKLYLILRNLKNFLQPGFSKNHHSFDKWLVSFIVSFPIFVLCYFGIIKNVVNDFKNHTIILSLFFMMLSFFIIFYTQNRFRVITIEPFYIIYTSYSVNYILNFFFQKFKKI